MSLLDHFVGPGSRGLAGEEVSLARTLSLEDGTVLHLQEDDTAENLVLFSLPGRLRETAWLSEDVEPWNVGRPHPRLPGVDCVLAVDPADGQVYLIDVAWRAVLDDVSFAHLIADHKARHRRWRDVGDLVA